MALPMTVMPELEDFVRLHREHGRPTPDVGPPTPNGCRLEVACPCGSTFARWITPEEKLLDPALQRVRMWD